MHQNKYDIWIFLCSNEKLFFSIINNRLLSHRDGSLLHISSRFKAKCNNKLNSVEYISIWPSDSVALYSAALLSTEYILRDLLVITWAHVSWNGVLCTTRGQDSASVMQKDVCLWCQICCSFCRCQIFEYGKWKLFSSSLLSRELQGDGQRLRQYLHRKSCSYSDMGCKPV